MQNFNELLAAATAGISAEYFQLPIAGSEDPQYRERVYCHELYHQLRVRWPSNSDYSLAGEVDKAGHRLFRGNQLDNRKPDFLVHVPGDMGGNFAVLEVKSIVASLKGVRKDLETLSAFLTSADYEQAIYLIYGRPDDGNGLANAVTEIQKCEQRHRIQLWKHTAPRVSATFVEHA